MKLPRLLCIVVIYNICVVLAQEECADEADFMCRSDKKCINSTLVCNQRSDCNDNSDEENCSKY